MIREPDSRQPIFNLPGVIRVLAGLTILVHFRQIVLTTLENNELLRYFTFIAWRFQIPETWQYEGVSLALSPITYAFFHADGYHLLMNVFFLLAFGTAVARRMSWLTFTLLYIAGAIVSAFFWMAFNADEVIPLVGASGALSAAAGALVRISLKPKLPHDPRHPIMPPRTAIMFATFWIGMNLLFSVFAAERAFGLSNVAWEAHIGGFVFGFIVGRLLDGRGLATPIAPPPGSL